MHFTRSIPKFSQPLLLSTVYMEMDLTRALTGLQAVTEQPRILVSYYTMPLPDDGPPVVKFVSSLDCIHDTQFNTYLGKVHSCGRSREATSISKAAIICNCYVCDGHSIYFRWNWTFDANLSQKQIQNTKPDGHELSFDGQNLFGIKMNP